MTTGSHPDHWKGGGAVDGLTKRRDTPLLPVLSRVGVLLAAVVALLVIAAL